MNGFNTHRHKSNPKEKELHDKFKAEIIEYKYSQDQIHRLVFGHSNNNIIPNDYLSDREQQIVLSAIQWLGSPVGQSFLKSCSFEQSNKQ